MHNRSGVQVLEREGRAGRTESNAEVHRQAARLRDWEQNFPPSTHAAEGAPCRARLAPSAPPCAEH